MGTRVKDFEATGVAPNGRLYAGDLNAIQDKYADQSNFSQSVDVASLAVGSADLRLLKYGTAEGRFSGALRLDGILRGLGGLYAGAFTTAARNAIPAGSRPYGLVILNSELNQYEWNKGTDATPNWVPLGTDPTLQGIPIGMVCEWPWAAATIPAWALLSYGQAISRATFSALHNLAQLSGYPYGNGDGAATFNITDHRGRVSVGKDDMGGTAANRLTVGISGIGTSLGAVGGVEGITLTTGQIPAHNHAATGLTIASHNHGGGVHNHGINDPGHGHDVADHETVGIGYQSGNVGYAGGDRNPFQITAIPNNTTGITVNNSGVVVASEAPAVSGTTGSVGGGAVHSNVQPTLIVNKLIRAL